MSGLIVVRIVPESPVDAVTFSYSLTMIPNWFQAVRRAYDILGDDLCPTCPRRGETATAAPWPFEPTPVRAPAWADPRSPERPLRCGSSAGHRLPAEGATSGSGCRLRCAANEPGHRWR